MSLPFTPGPAAPRIASGREADIFAYGEGRVLRRYRDGHDASREAEVMAHLSGHGYPVPAVYEARGPELVMERLAGPTMAQSLLAGGWPLATGR